MGQTIRYLFEYKFSIRLLQPSLPLDEPQEVSSSSILHYHQQVLAAFENFEESNDIRMLDFLQQVYFLENFPLREIVFHVGFFYCLNSYVLSCQLVNP